MFVVMNSFSPMRCYLKVLGYPKVLTPPPRGTPGIQFIIALDHYGLAPLPHFAFSDALSLQEHTINLNDYDPAAIASLGHFVEFAK